LIRDIAQASFTRCEEVLDTELANEAALEDGVLPLANNFATFGKRLFAAPEFAEVGSHKVFEVLLSLIVPHNHQRIDNILTKHAYRLLGVAPSLVLTYLSHRGDEEQCSQLWHSLLEGMSQQPNVSQSSLPTLLDAVQRGLLPSYLQPKAGELDGIIEKMLASALDGSGGPAQMNLLRQLLQNSGKFNAL
jgi:hypothetical protein